MGHYRHFEDVVAASAIAPISEVKPISKIVVECQYAT
jgi:hypothetical protein